MRQAAVLDALIREARGADAVDVLDCSCGIGTQAIGLAAKGYRVQGTDISERSIERARDEAERLGQEVSFDVADFRDLDSVAGDFDVVLSCDNALPHLLVDQEIDLALRAMGRKLRPRGFLVISIRDYDKALVERPAMTSRLFTGPPRRIDLRLQSWDGPDLPTHTTHIFLLTEADHGWQLSHHATRYRALTRAALTTAVEHAGFVDITWRDGNGIGFHQPVLTALHPE
jgi:glycine/sarcosine N-methyltransferase